MSKKHRPQPEQPLPQQPAAPPAPQGPSERPVSNTQIIVFWSVVALTVIAARVLNSALPGVSESVIERWIMLAFAVFLGGFLYKLK